MARQLRLEYAGAIYHVMSRGDRQEAIFLDDEDRRRFLKTLGEACKRAGWGEACLFSDEKLFSLGGGDAATDFGGGDEVVFGNLHAEVQCAASDAGALVCWTLQVASGGWLG